MPRSKDKLRKGEPALGGWIMIGHPVVAEIMAGEGFDWIAVDLEHAETDLRAFYDIVRAVRGTGCDLLARLHSCDSVLAKEILDAGAQGIIVPSVNSPEEARQASAMARFPTAGTRGVSLCRATDFGRNFQTYVEQHNDNVLVVVMLEHMEAVKNVDEILATPGVDAALIGPYDLSASMGLAGQLGHHAVVAAQQAILDACRRHKVPAGIHVVATDHNQVQDRIAEGYRFIGCGIDTLFLIQGCRCILGKDQTP
jgi:2-dehydro-3-deoxyglucarate aldolase